MALSALMFWDVRVAADLVYAVLKGRARQAVLDLIHCEREGESIDRTLIKNLLDIYITMGMNSMECYEGDFEGQLLNTTAEYYRWDDAQGLDLHLAENAAWLCGWCALARRRAAREMHSSTPFVFNI